MSFRRSNAFRASKRSPILRKSLVIASGTCERCSPSQTVVRKYAWEKKVHEINERSAHREARCEMKSTDRGGSRKGSKETESTMTWKEKAALKRLERKIRNGHGEVSPEVLMEYAERVMKE